MALHRRTNRGGIVPGHQPHSRTTVRRGDVLALLHGLLRSVLAFAVLGAADHVDVGVRRGGVDRVHQHLRQYRRPARLADRRQDENVQVYRYGMHAVSGVLLCGRRRYHCFLASDKSQAETLSAWAFLTLFPARLFAYIRASAPGGRRLEGCRQRTLLMVFNSLFFFLTLLPFLALYY